MRRPSHATVVAYLALFIALGGTAYAGLQITGRDVVDGSLRGRDIANASVAGRDVRLATLRSRHIRDGSLLFKDFRVGQLPPGPTGPTGPTGLRGPKGDKGDQGDPPTTAFAIVNADGDLLAGRGVVVSKLFDPVAGGPAYAVGFADDVHQCAVDISVVDTSEVNDFQAIPPGSGAAIFVPDNADPNTEPGVDSAIFLRVTREDGVVVKSPFEVSVIC
jgi:hypothetical protein